MLCEHIQDKAVPEHTLINTPQLNDMALKIPYYIVFPWVK